MSESPISIACNPANPVNYLACCGLFDLLARTDPNTRAWWNVEAPATFHLRSEVCEGDLLSMIFDTFCAPARWSRRPTVSVEPTWFSVTFHRPGSELFNVALDWWLETAALDGSIAANSAWKMFAGRQTVERLLLLEHKDEDKLGMVRQGARLAAQSKLPRTLAETFDFRLPMTSRFGFDPRSSRNALDVGWSANDLKVPISTALFVEMLALFGANSFFPARVARAGRPDSTRGWRARDDAAPAGFRYSLWTRPLPIALSRITAAAGDHPLFAARDDSRGKYKNLTLANPIEPNPHP